jgi:hypothetical protein
MGICFLCHCHTWILANCYVHPGNCAFIDAEHALDPALAESIGVKAEHMLLSQPDCGEQALGLADILIRSGSIDVVVVDSVGRMLLLSALYAFAFAYWVVFQCLGVTDRISSTIFIINNNNLKTCLPRDFCS